MKLNYAQAIENAANKLNREIKNASGFDVDITTLTHIRAKVTEQKFYEVRPSDYMPVNVGEGGWNDFVLTYQSLSNSDDFEAGITNSNSANTKLAQSESEIRDIQVPVKLWAGATAYNIAELGAATESGNWSLIESKETARFKTWQLGLQRVAFLGLDIPGVLGLLTQPDVTVNTAIITKDISAMTATEFQAFLAAILGAYFDNSNSTTLPDTFIIPMDDFLGLGSAVDEVFNMKSRLQRIRESFIEMTGNEKFMVKGLAYAQQERNNLTKNRYVLYRREDDTGLRLDVPLPYTTTIFDTVNGFQYQSAAYGRFTGCKTYRPAEMIYFDYANA
jgi:hypothetical protein